MKIHGLVVTQVEKLVGTMIEKKTHNREKKKFIFILNEILTINSFISSQSTVLNQIIIVKLLNKSFGKFLMTLRMYLVFHEYPNTCESYSLENVDKSYALFPTYVFCQKFQSRMRDVISSRVFKIKFSKS